MGSEMHEDYLLEEKGSSTRLLRRGVSIYYIGSMFFVAGIALVALGSAFIMIFQIHYGSETNQILYTAIFLGTGEIAGKKLSIKHIPGPLGVRGRNSDNHLIEEKLGWAPSLSLKAGLEKTYPWIRNLVDQARK